MPSSANHPPGGGAGGGAAGVSGRPVNAAAAAAALSSDISRRNPQEDYELLQVRSILLLQGFYNKDLTNFERFDYFWKIWLILKEFLVNY